MVLLEYLAFLVGSIILLYLIINLIHHLNKKAGWNLFWLSDQWSKGENKEDKFKKWSHKD